MKSLNKKGLVALTLASAMLVASACGGGDAPKESAGSGDKGKAATSSGPKKVVFWHAMGGNNQKVVEQMAADFNSSQKDIVVEAIYQGAYDDLLSKLKASMGSKDSPTLVQMYEIGTRFMIDSKTTTPMQKFIDMDKYDLSQLEPNITGYYTINGKLNSMPFNTSNPILYYNKDLFKAAGLDAEKPPKTFDELQKAADAITKTGKATGANFAIYGWFMEQLLANQGAEFVNNGNGRTALATESTVNNEAAVKTLTWWKNLVDTKAAINLGRKTDDSKKAFAAGQVGMILESTAGLKGIIDSAQGKFEVGTGFLPKPADGKEGGTVVGGASLWIQNDRPEDEQKAAWEFVKFITSPKEQAYWHVNTGYFPISKKAYDEQLVKDNLKKFPQFQTAIDQLHQTKSNTATQGAVIGVFPEARQIVENAIEEALNNKKAPKEALDAAAKEITTKIQTYNKTVKQ